jgi:hypothetical protein
VASLPVNWECGFEIYKASTKEADNFFENFAILLDMS